MDTFEIVLLATILAAAHERLPASPPLHENRVTSFVPTTYAALLVRDAYRSAIREQLLEIADTMPLAPMAAAREKKVRAFVKETVGDLLINQRTN